ncbi:MAG: FtsH protease activity modulator HflK [Eubacteriales bacterium]|nr:FtsH protease activity modulator HflK [Eubacteriales bacterium]
MYRSSNIDLKKNKKKIIRFTLITAAVIFAISLFSSMFYTVSDKEVAVLTTFGEVTGIQEAGIHFKLPFGMQKVYYVEVNETKTIEIGYRTNSDGSTYPVNDESKMITGDFNIINVDFFIEYRISDPEKYIFASGEPESILKMLIQSQIRNVIGSYEIDPILTESKDQIQIAIKDLTVIELAKYDIGLSINDIKMQDSEPPTSAVNEAFAAVKNADSGAKTAINNANAYKNTKDAEAEARVDSIIKNAEYLKLARINEAYEEIAMFNAMYEEYAKYPEVTRTRMYYECLESFFPGITVYIDTSGNGDLLKLLPLDTITSGTTGGN